MTTTGTRGAALKPVRGATPVARFVLGVLRRFVPAGSTVRPAEINGQPGFIAYLSGRPHAARVDEDGCVSGCWTDAT